MKKAQEKATILMEALPYFKKFSEKYIVVKLGGAALNDISCLDEFLQDVAYLRQIGARPIIVHGGGPMISKALKEKNIEFEFINGRRKTTEQVLEVVKDVLVNEVNSSIVRKLMSLGAKSRAFPLNGRILRCEKSSFTDENGKNYDLGLVGNVAHVLTGLLQESCLNGEIPVIAPIGFNEEHDFNVNADIAAAAVAGALSAEKVVFLSDTHGIFRDINNPDSRYSTLTETQVEELIEQGIITGGMLPKVDACMTALKGGVRKAHIIDGRIEHSILLEIFTVQGVGTEIIHKEGSAFEALKKDYDDFVCQNYTRIPICITKGRGSWIEDLQGNTILDMFSGWAVSGIGHCHPEVVKAIQEQAAQLIHMPNNFYNETQGRLAKRIVKEGFEGKCFFCNSGAEAVESCLKLARLTHQKTLGKHEIVTFENSFHGRTYGAMTATAQPLYQKGSEPLVPGFKYAKFNDIDSVKSLVNEKTAAVMLELIQGEGGVNIAEKRFIEELKELAEKFDFLLIFDEVQTGIGRTGEMFAFKHFGIEPDIMSLAKSLAGGVSMGAMVAKPSVAENLVPGTHASTFGGNPLACAAALAVFDAIENEKMLENTRIMGKYVEKQLDELAGNFPVIKAHRSIGLMHGIDLEKDGAKLVEISLAKGLLINCTHSTVIRFFPPLNVRRDEIDRAIEIFAEALVEFGS